MRAKKSLGQHFLKSERALEKIALAGDIKESDTILEIGPGLGALTEKLIEKAGRVIAVEKDDQLFEFLKNKFPTLELVHGDILEFDPPANYKLIANIPYNITGAILKKFLGAMNKPLRMVLLVQKEVAERIVAKDSKESILSISVKVYGTPKYIETVKAGSFAPAPKVDSAIICVENISKDFFENISESKFFEILHLGFGQKRKKLLGNLSQKFDREKVREVFQSLNLDENLRAEDLKVGDWQNIARNLE